jgi:two-component system OmpR family sensor kinase
MNRIRLRRPRLRTQLVALLVAMLAVAFLTTALITTLQLHGFLLDRLDQQLRAAGVRFSVSLEHPSDDDTDDGQLAAVTGQAAGTLGARVEAGTLTAAAVVGREGGADATRPDARATAILAQVRPNNRPRSVSLPGLGEYRLLAVRGDDGDTLITGLPMRPVEDTIERLVGIEAVVFGVALLLVTGISLVAVRLALRPLNRVAETAARVADLPLSSGTVTLAERAPPVAPHTEVGTVASAFNQMLEHVEASLLRRQSSEERLRRFLADASHELRTPVAVIRSHAEYAQRTYRSQLPDDLRTALRRIDAESQRMGHLVDDLLLLARLDSGRPLARSRVDLSRLAVDAVSDARVAGPAHTWRLDLAEEPVTTTGDEHALHQALANLLANARTHTPAGTTVVTAVRRTVDGVEFTVDDDGPGIPADVLPTIFERFVRADPNRSTDTGSSGLGLAIVNAIVRSHSGHISVSSEPGHTRFTVQLPDATARIQPGQ